MYCLLADRLIDWGTNGIAFVVDSESLWLRLWKAWYQPSCPQVTRSHTRCHYRNVPLTVLNAVT